AGPSVIDTMANAAFLYGAVKVGLAPLRAMCLALLSATLFSTGMWAVTNQVSSSDGLLPVREQFASQIAVVEKQLDKIQEKGQESSGLAPESVPVAHGSSPIIAGAQYSAA
ncbi:MAG TPA: hypothetical protein PLB81_09000, partial [Deltaproteobacteria bacterium]|nr:hypothetical protein [Deltaproteobacteria bacterium]